MSEPRKVERARSLLSAQISFNNRNSTVDCVVRNISPAGARLQIADSIALPTEFDLHIPHKNRYYLSRIAWRADDQVGVEFLDANRVVAANAGADAGPHETDAQQIDRLMRENVQLKRQVLELKQRVAQLTGDE